MIYSIYLLDNTTEKPLYIAGDNEKCVYNAVLNEKLNDAGSLTFTVPPTNPNYSLIEERRKVFLYEGTDKIWRGFIVSYEKNSRNELKVTCIGELAYLNNTIQPQHKYQNMTPLQLFTAYVNEHNTQATEDFTVGMVTVTDPNDSVYRYTNYESTLTALREDLCESLEGYLRIRWENNTRYLDLVKLVDYGRANGQLIEFGSNLLDYAEGISAEDIATACLPLGAKLDTPVVDGLDAYLDIKSVNNNVDYVQDATAVAAYGLIKKVVHWDNVTVASNLKAKAIEWLTTAQYANMTLSIKAVDMSALNVYVAPKKWIDYTNEEWNELANKTWESLNRCDGYIEKFNVGDRVRCFATPYSMDATYPIQEKTTYLQDPTKNYIELSNTRKKTYTQMQYEATADVKKEQSTVLASAQHNASELIKNANEGHVYIKYGTDGKAEEFCIMDTDSPDTATKVWRWNLSGFGYSNTGYGGTYTTAITMDGGIVADFITAGTMSCNRLNGGTISGQYISGGNISGTNINNGNGTFTVNSSGNMTANSGSIGCWNISSDGAGLYSDKMVGGAKKRVYIQPYLDQYGEDSWLISSQNWAVGATTTDDAPFKVTYGGKLYLGSADYGRRLNVDGTVGSSGNMYAPQFVPTSRVEQKDNIVPSKDMLNLVNDTEIYEYQLKCEKENNIEKKHYGVIIGEGYDHTPEEIVSYDEEGVSTYDMTSVLWKAVQELSAKVEELETKLNEKGE